jgi:putative ABC transport system ATP-binding protein
MFHQPDAGTRASAERHAAAPLLELEDVEMDRGGKGGGRYLLRVRALRLERGARLGLVGPSGSGKSTLLEILGLMSWPTRIGAFQLARRDANAAEPPHELAQLLRARDGARLTPVRASRVGFVPQDGGLLPYLDVMGNARLAARLARDAGGQGLDAPEIKRLADRIGLGGPLLRRAPGVLSGGQRQRAAVLRALAAGSDLIIGDEPTGALDPSTSADVMRQIEACAAAAGAAVVLASHDETLLRAHGYRVARIVETREAGARVATLEPEDAS